MQYSYISTSQIGLKRTNNEDAVGIFELENGLLVIVCDGLGGNKGGDVASKLTVQSLYDFFYNSDEKDFLKRIRNSIISSNNVIFEKASHNTHLKGMATTAEILFLHNDSVYLGHVGDSRIYCFVNGKLKQLTKDHSLVQKLVDEGYLSLKEAENHPNKNIITRALGDSKLLDVDVSRVKINSKDKVKFFVCTDGVNAVIKDFELSEFLDNENLDQIKKTLSETIENRGAPDNYSFVIIAKK